MADTYPRPPDGEDFYSRFGQTRIELHTGGKSRSKAWNLFTLRGSAQQVLDKPLPRDGWTVVALSIAPQTIVIPNLGWQHLGADGNLYVLLPDNAVINVTPVVPDVDFYRYSLHAIKHKLVIRANDVVIEPRRVAPGALFCVGQKVRLKATLEPEPPGVKITDAIWKLSPKFVNAIRSRPQKESCPLITTCHPKTVIKDWASSHPFGASDEYYLRRMAQAPRNRGLVVLGWCQADRLPARARVSKRDSANRHCHGLWAN